MRRTMGDVLRHSPWRPHRANNDAALDDPAFLVAALAGFALVRGSHGVTPQRGGSPPNMSRNRFGGFVWGRRSFQPPRASSDMVISFSDPPEDFLRKIVGASVSQDQGLEMRAGCHTGMTPARPSARSLDRPYPSRSCISCAGTAPQGLERAVGGNKLQALRGEAITTCARSPPVRFLSSSRGRRRDSPTSIQS